jgi:hypothetical protein
MWNLVSDDHIGGRSGGDENGDVGAMKIAATQNASVLKRSYQSSSSLPPSEVRVYNSGAQVRIKLPPQNASDSKYWLVHVADR